MAVRFSVFPVVYLSIFSSLTIAFINRKKLLPNFEEITEKQRQEGFDKAREIKRQLKEGVEEKRKSGQSGQVLINNGQNVYMMLSSSKRKFNGIEKTDSIAPEVKRGKISETCDLSSLYLDENIPHNMQKVGTDHTALVSALESTGMKKSLDDVNGFKEQKPLRKSRLNLKKGRAVRSNKEGETEACLKNECSSTVIDKQYSDKLGDQEDVNDCESALKCLGHNEHTDMQCCVVCGNDISLLESDTELNTHINNCLDNAKNDSTKTSTSSASQKEFFFCEICKRDIRSYNTVQRQQHYNRCCDSVEDIQTKKVAAQKQLSCLICGQICKNLKSRQSHMKRCAKKNNVSTTQLVELNRNENIENHIINNGVSKEFVSGVQAHSEKVKERSNKRKKNTRILGKNVDDETQLALALSASLQSNEKDNKGLQKRSKKKNKGRTEVPALLLRNDIEMKKVTEARAAAVLCHWTDSDEEIQSTPALAPSSLLKKYMSSNSETGTLETISEYSEPDKDLPEKFENEDMDVNISNLEKESDDVIKKNTTTEKANESEKSDEIASAVTIVKKDDSNEKKLIIDQETRLWCVSSLCAKNLSESNFYVPNLLPKTTPRKKKLVRRSSSQATEEQKEFHAAYNEEKDGNQVSPVKTSDANDRTTVSQELDIQLLAELVGEERSDDIQSNVDEKENEKREETWYHSSGFCVTKDGHEEEKNRNIESLLNDLSSMVGNRLLSDVKILAKNKQRFFAHSFMLAARCSTLAKMLNEKTCDNEDDSHNNFITLEMMDIDVRALHAVMTFIYTASYVPVSHNVIDDVKKLVQRLNLNCDFHAWEELNDSVHGDNEVLVDCEDELELDGAEGDQQTTDLDVLLKSLWEGEDITENTAEEEENAFGDSILDEDLNDLEIKIYTQVTPKKNNGSTEETSGLNLNNACEKVKGKSFIEESPLHLDSKEDIAGSSSSESRGEDFLVVKSIVKVMQGSNCDDVEEINMRSEVSDNSGDSDGWFVPQTPPRPALDLSKKSRMNYEHEIEAIKEDVLLEDVAEPKKISTALTRKQQEKQQCCGGNTSDSHVRAFNRQLSSVGDVNCFSRPCPLTPQRSSSLNKSNVNNSLSRFCNSISIHGLSLLSPVEIIVSPTSPKPVFSEQDDGNFAMDTEVGDVTKSEELECRELANSELQPVSETSLNVNKSFTEDMNVDCEQDVSISLSIPRNVSSHAECVTGNENDFNENESCFGNPCDDQDFYCYDDGGFNCDIVDYLDTSCNLDADLQCNETDTKHEETEEPVVKEVQSRAGSCEIQVRNDHDEPNVSERSGPARNKRQQLESQNSRTPMLDYSKMATPDLTVELKQYGVRPLPKRKMVVKLKEIYQFTHGDTSSESELEDPNNQRSTTTETETRQCNQENTEESRASRSNSDEGSTQDSGESSDGSGRFSDDELSKDDDVLSQESSLNLSKKLMKCLTQNNELYLRILRYEPVVLSSIEEILKDNKIKCSTAKLKDFLDEQCITFTEPRPARVKKKQRRGKTKSQKNN